MSFAVPVFPLFFLNTFSFWPVKFKVKFNQPKSGLEHTVSACIFGYNKGGSPLQNNHTLKIRLIREEAIFQQNYVSWLFR